MDFLTIGHVAKDIYPGGYSVGGTVTYASVTALRLGKRPAVLTSLGPDVTLPPVYDHIELMSLPAAASTTFENVYTPKGRVQTLHAVAETIEVADVPAAWRTQPEIVLLGPLCNEIDPAVAGIFSTPMLGVVPQGWMRRWDAQGRVTAKPLDCADRVLTYADVLILSVEDVDYDLELARCYSEQVKLMVLTRADFGCDVYLDGQIIPVPPRAIEPVDPTGAGDVFAASFLIRFAETGDPIVSARFANVVASFNVEARGYSGIPTRAQVEAWLAEND